MRESGRSENLRLSNEGFTLVELIVSVLILSVVALMITIFVRVSVNSYVKAESDSALQNSATTASTFIRDVLTEAATVSSKEPCRGENGGVTHTGSCLKVEGYDGTIGLIVFDDTDGCIYYHVCEGGIPLDSMSQPDYSAAAAGTFGNRYELLAENYRSWSISSQGHLVSMTLVFAGEVPGQGEKEYTTTLKCECRNAD